jgi:hypothetical protein
MRAPVGAAGDPGSPRTLRIRVPLEGSLGEAAERAGRGVVGAGASGTTVALAGADSGTGFGARDDAGAGSTTFLGGGEAATGAGAGFADGVGAGVAAGAWDSADTGADSCVAGSSAEIVSAGR